MIFKQNGIAIQGLALIFFHRRIQKRSMRLLRSNPEWYTVCPDYMALSPGNQRRWRLLAECVYSAKFIAEGQAKRLVERVICDFISTHQAEKIKHDALLTDRVKTNNKAVLRKAAGKLAAFSASAGSVRIRFIRSTP